MEIRFNFARIDNGKKKKKTQEKNRAFVSSGSHPRPTT